MFSQITRRLLVVSVAMVTVLAPALVQVAQGKWAPPRVPCGVWRWDVKTLSARASPVERRAMRLQRAARRAPVASALARALGSMWNAFLDDWPAATFSAVRICGIHARI